MESLALRSGMTLTLSHFEPGAACSFRFTEPEDVFGFGFHLAGGAQFDTGNGFFKTSALDVWASGAPRGSTSEFQLPAEGFRTLSLRMSPAVAETLFADAQSLPSATRRVLTQSGKHSAMASMSQMRGVAIARLGSMFTTSYEGLSRRLYLESCVLDLLASQLSQSAPTKTSITPKHRGKAIEAREFLDSCLGDPPTIAELARLIGTNEFTLKRAFKATHGITVFGYVLRERMRRASELLDQGATVASTAAAVGYSCTRSFSVAFQREFGFPPSVMRRRR